MTRRSTGTAQRMTTTPSEPVEDPEVVPSGDPDIDPAQPDRPEGDPDTDPLIDPELP